MDGLIFCVYVDTETLDLHGLTLCMAAAPGLISRLLCKDNVDMETFDLL